MKLTAETDQVSSRSSYEGNALSLQEEDHGGGDVEKGVDQKVIKYKGEADKVEVRGGAAYKFEGGGKESKS